MGIGIGVAFSQQGIARIAPMAGTISPDWNTHGACGWCKGATGLTVPCWCATCHGNIATNIEDPIVAISLHHMFLCPDCGNKRCPRATWHELACTGSNAPGQPGSAYA